MVMSDADIEVRMEENRVKALEAMVRGNYLMFGHWACNWVRLNKRLTLQREDPFAGLRNVAAFMGSREFEAQEKGGISEYEHYSRADWLHASENGDTSLGYWEWVWARRQEETKVEYRDQYGDLVPELCPIPAYDLCDDEHVETLDNADWYEIDGMILVPCSVVLSCGFDCDDLADVGVTMEGAEIFKIDRVLHRYSDGDGWYHA